MPKGYFLSESDQRGLRQVINWWRGGGAGKSGRPTPTRRTPRGFGGAGRSKAASAAANMGIVIQSIPAVPATGFELTDPADPFTWEIEPGKLGETPLEQAGEGGPLVGTSDEGVLLLDWKRNNDTKGKYLAASYLSPLEKLVPVYERNLTYQAPDPLPDPLPDEAVQPAWRAAINLSATDIRASIAEPIGVMGYLQKLEGTFDLSGGAPATPIDSDEVHEVFFITNVMDLRSLPNYATGIDPAAGAQAPYHAGGSRGFRLGHGECVEP